MDTAPGTLHTADGQHLGNVASIDLARAARAARLSAQSVGWTNSPAYLAAQRAREERDDFLAAERWIENMPHARYVETFGEPRPQRLAIAITRALTPES